MNRKGYIYPMLVYLDAKKVDKTVQRARQVGWGREAAEAAEAMESENA